MRYVPFFILFVWACHGPEHHEPAWKRHQESEVVLENPVSQPILNTDSFEHGRPFSVVKRSDQLKHAPCVNCHPAEITPDAPKAHWDIKLSHGNATTLSCQTCHQSGVPDPHLLNGEAVSFDQSFKVCAQCHSTQFEDWKNGAHGKRLNGWATDPIRQTCTGCHNPHNPAFPVRWPSTMGTPVPNKE